MPRWRPWEYRGQPGERPGDNAPPRQWVTWPGRRVPGQTLTRGAGARVVPAETGIEAGVAFRYPAPAGPLTPAEEEAVADLGPAPAYDSLTSGINDF